MVVKGSADLETRVESFKSKVQQQQAFSSSYTLAQDTAKLLLKIVNNLKWTSSLDLLDYLQDLHKSISNEQISQGSVSGNVILRMIKIISGEDSSSQLASSEQFMNSLLKRPLSQRKSTSDSSSLEEIKETFLDCINEYIAELENSCSSVATQSIEHIHDNEIVLTIGYSKTVEAFLKKASEKRNFQVLVAEAAPACKGHELAKKLLEANIETTVLPDSNIFTVMSRVNKVIIGAKLILADGSIIASAGTQMVAQAAKHFLIPVICCGAFYKVTPKHLSSQDQQQFNSLLSASMTLPPKCSSSLQTVAVNPAYDLVSSQLISLLISNSGAHDPSYIFKLIFDLYPSIE